MQGCIPGMEYLNNNLINCVKYIPFLINILFKRFCFSVCGFIFGSNLKKDDCFSHTHIIS
jgi:hypothetical protein